MIESRVLSEGRKQIIQMSRKMGRSLCPRRGLRQWGTGKASVGRAGGFPEGDLRKEGLRCGASFGPRLLRGPLALTGRNVPEPQAKVWCRTPPGRGHGLPPGLLSAHALVLSPGCTLFPVGCRE